MWLRNTHYKAIVALGRPAVACILRDLARYEETKDEDAYPGWWSMYALPSITGVRIRVGGPEVKAEQGFAKVDVGAVAKFWIDWGRKEGLAF